MACAGVWRVDEVGREIAEARAQESFCSCPVTTQQTWRRRPHEDWFSHRTNCVSQTCNSFAFYVYFYNIALGTSYLRVNFINHCSLRCPDILPPGHSSPRSRFLPVILPPVTIPPRTFFPPVITSPFYCLVCNHACNRSSSSDNKTTLPVTTLYYLNTFTNS